MRTFLRENGLSIFFLQFSRHGRAQSFAGQQGYNAERRARRVGVHLVGVRHVAGVRGALMENWQSEFLQFTLFIFATVWLVQKGVERVEAPRGRRPRDRTHNRRSGATTRGAPRWAKPDDWRTTRLRELAVDRHDERSSSPPGLPSRSTTGVMFNAEQRGAREATVAWGALPRSTPDFWETDAAELAVGVPRRRRDGRLHDLPTPARLARVEAGRVAARRDRILRARLASAPKPA